MEKRGNHNCETAKIRVRTPLKLGIYFRFVSETAGAELTKFPSHMQNFVKPVKNCIRIHSRTDEIDTEIGF